jgi:hypothetical protein
LRLAEGLYERTGVRVSKSVAKECDMRELTVQEMDSVSGGLVESLGALTGIEAGLTFGAVAGAVISSFSAGYAAGTWANETFGISDAIVDGISGDAVL